jgi:imidazolonepropionase-like amidohydrolase
MADRVLVSPVDDKLYCHRVVGANRWVPIADDVILVPTMGGAETQLAPVSSHGRFALSADGKNLYLGDGGYLWKVLLPSGGSQALAFQAHAKLEVQDVVKPTRPLAEEGHTVRSISSPRLSPDGRTLIFGAAGYIWRQRLDGGKPQRISRDTALESEPAFSPDGHQLAFVHTEHGEDSLRLLDLVTGQARELTSEPSISELAWSSNGQRLVALVAAGFDQHIIAFSLADGKREQLADAGFWSPRPQLSADGQALYYSADANGIGNLYRLALSKDAKPEQVTHLSRHLSDARVSPDGKWLVFRRNHSVLMASLAKGGIQDADVHQLTNDGGDSFALTPDGTSVIYAIGPHVWRQPLAGGSPQEILVVLDLPHPLPPPILLRAVRVLDLGSGTFGLPTSLLLENGRIRWIGGEAGHSLPEGTSIVDATGRFAIPGLFDLHVHSVGANEEAFLAYGVTSLRDTGGGLVSLNALEDRSEFTGLPIPRYFYSGEILEGERPIWGDGFLQIDNEQDAREYVRRLKQGGASFIKVYFTLSWPLKRAVAHEAHRLGLPVVGHGTSPEEIIKSVALGFFSLEHTSSREPVFDDMLQMLAASGTSWDPTLAVMGGNSLLLRDHPEQLTDEKFKAFTPLSYIEFARSGGYNRLTSTAALRGSLSAQLATIERAHELGVKLLAGTDAPNPECFFGSSVHWELARFVEAGISPVDVLRLATEGAAAAVGTEDLGTIAPGKLADIVLLQANPLENIRNTETIWRVVKGGWMFDPQKLQKASNHLSASEKAVHPNSLDPR